MADDDQSVWVFLNGQWRMLSGLSGDEISALIEGLQANREAAYTQGYEAGLLAGRAEQ